MAIPSGTTNQKTPSQEEPFIIPSFGNVGPPLMATLILPGLTIGLIVWLFSIMVIPSAPIVSNLNSPSHRSRTVTLSPSHSRSPLIRPKSLPTP